MTGRKEMSWDIPLPTAGGSKAGVAYETLCEAVISGRLFPGVRIPSSRSLAARWGWSRITIETAYEKLRTEGYLESRPGSGTFVCLTLPGLLERADTLSGRGSQPQPLAPTEEFRRKAGLHPGVAFIARLPDANIFPWSTWVTCLKNSVSRYQTVVDCQDDLQGYYPLRQQIARYLGVSRGIVCQAEDILITTGIRQGLDICSRVLLGADTKVCIEEPGYTNARQIFALATSNVIPISVTSDGIDVEGLSDHQDCSLLYVTPAHQAPTGVMMSLARRKALLDWSVQTGAWIVEDDYDSEFNYSLAPLPALKSLAPDAVIFCGSFNKTLFTELRIGYLLAPAAVRKRFIELRKVVAGTHNIIEQQALTLFMENGGLAKHLRIARAEYRRRRDAIVAVFTTRLNGSFELSGHECGMHLVLWHIAFQDTEVRQKLAALGIELQYIERLHPTTNLCQGAIVGYSSLPLLECQRAAFLLAQELNGRAETG